MRESHIPITSFMNGGHTDQSYRLNAELFRLKTMLQHAQKETRSW